MASSYDNNLRLDELATGDGSGTWGTTTNTNLTLIADALGFQSFTVANANADDLIIPNGTETNNEAISLYVKLTGGDQAATITLGPNTVKKLWIIENSTSHVMTLTQGSGADVILASGVTKMVYANGTGSGASVVDALVGLEVGTTLSIKNAATGDNSTAQLFLQTAEADIQANDVLGKINFQAPNEGEGTDALLVSAAIQAISEGDFSSSSNATSLAFMTGASEAAATKMTLSSAGDLTLTSTTASSSSTTGAVKIGGGLGVAADLFVGDDLDVTGAVVIDETALVTGVLTTTATQVATGGITSGSNIVSDTDSTDDLGTTGARWANLFVDAITATDQITATGFTGTLDGILGSGAAAAATVTTLNTSDVVNLNLTTDSTSSTSGALIIDGGVGVAKKLFVGETLAVTGIATFTDDIIIGDGKTIGSASTVGAITIASDGDITLSADLNVGANFDVTGNAVIDGTALVTGVLTTTAATVFNGGFAANAASTVDGTLSTSGGLVHLGDANTSLDFGTDVQTFFVGGVRALDLNTAAIVFNEGGADVDFRVESSGNANMLIVNGGNDRVGIGADPTAVATGQFIVVKEGNSAIQEANSYRASPGGSVIVLSHSRGTSQDSFTILADNDQLGRITWQAADGTDMTTEGAQIHAEVSGTPGENDMPTAIVFSNTADGASSITESMRIDQAGNVFIGTADTNIAVEGTVLYGTGNEGVLQLSSTAMTPLYVNRSNDGVLIDFRSAAANEGNINVSGNTVSLVGFSGRHESSGIPTNTERGTVVSTIDELDVYPQTQNGIGSTIEPCPKAGQKRLDHAKVKVSDSVGDACVYGVVAEFTAHDKLIVTSLGIGSVRVTGACAKGNLLESNGDGTAKVQSDDIVRSKTLGKVTIGSSDTGVKLVSCVMYCG